jgi:polysaccharide biosynthesis protein PelA
LLGGNPAGTRVARELFALPHVEVGSHTHTHPYNWEFFNRYDRTAEETLIKGYRPPEQPLRERLSAALMRAAGKPYINTRYDPYVAGTDEMPRTYLRRPFSLELEVKGALTFAEQLAPRGKTAKLYQWSGDTTPFEAAVRATRQAGVRNINGGDTRLDREYPSVAYVPSIGRTVGAERQIYAVNSNENTYTNEWTGPFGGQLMLEHTLRNTDSPRRLKAFNLYYHMYSGEKQAALTAVKRFLDMARTSEITPLAASDYAAIADDFYTTEVQQVDLFSWAVLKRGAMQTMRFDSAAALTVNIPASQGVLGYRWHEDQLFVALDSAIERAIITLMPRAQPAATAPAGTTPISLVQSRWRFSDLRRRDCGGTVTAQGFGPGDMVWRVGSNRRLQVVAARQGNIVADTKVISDADGNATVSLPAIGLEPVEIRLICNE